MKLFLLACFPLLAQLHSVDPPTAPGSGMPFFAQSPQGAVYLSWLEPTGDKQHALRMASWTGQRWTTPETISTGANWFINWADFPALSFDRQGNLYAHWLARPNQGGKYGYGIRLARRAAAAGSPWQTVASFNETGTEDYAGFLSFAGSTAAYLAPPVTVAGEHRKTLRLVDFTPDGRMRRDVEIDADVCSCCQTATVSTPQGLLIAYRDHEPGEIRDISLVRVRDGKASAPETLHRDGWKINGCPTEGPSAAVAGPTVGIAWLTRAGGQARLRLSWSTDGGLHFAPPVAADTGNPLGRPHLLALSADSFLLVWLERIGSEAEIRLRRVSPAGQLAPPLTVARVPAGRGVGLPRIARLGNQVLVAWREESVRVSWLPIEALPAIPTRGTPQP